jgi:hypothetical protein
MTRPVSPLRLLLLATIALLAGAGAGRPQQPPPARDQAATQSEPPAGTGRISVLAVAEDNGAPIKRLRVTLSGFIPRAPVAPGVPPTGIATFAGGGGVTTPVGGVMVSTSAPAPPGRVQREAETDDSGRVDFTGLPAASYSISVQAPPAGFVRSDAPAFVPLKEGASASATIRLMRAGAITGRILDESGDPLSRVNVRAVRKDAGFGYSRLATVGAMATSDDRGQYRIYDLAPGDYYVSASVTSQYVYRPPEQVQPGPRDGYVPTFHPGVGALEGAQAVPVKSGQDTGGVEFALLRGRLGRITGTVVDSTGAPFSPFDGHVALYPRNREWGGYAARTGSLQADGTFTFNDVPPGAYTLTAMKVRRTGDQPPQANPVREGGSVAVTVNGDEVVASLRTNLGAVLSGRVIREGPMPPPSPNPDIPLAPLPPQAMRVMLSLRPPADSLLSGGYDLGRPEVSEDGTFTIAGARGSLILTASSAVGVVKSIRRGTSELLGVPLELSGTERIDDIEIVLSTDTGWLRGSVRRADGRPAEGAWVIAFSADNPRLWSVPFVGVSRATPPAALTSAALSSAAPGARVPVRSPGDFMMGRLLSGRYYVAAVESPGNGFPAPDAEQLNSLKPKAVTVTIVAGKTTTVQLKQ